MLCGALGVLAHVARDRLPPNNLAGSPDLNEGRIQDRATSHTSTEIGASEAQKFATPDPACFCRSPAPRSQGCEVARVLPRLDTATQNKFPRWRAEKDGWKLLLKQNFAVSGRKRRDYV